LFNFCSAKFYY